jgi:hypothetical protein
MSAAKKPTKKPNPFAKKNGEQMPPKGSKMPTKKKAC